jgi:hypothetical protein
MTPWFGLTLVCCVLLGLLLGLTQAVDWNYQPVVRSGSSFDRGAKATSDSPTSSVVESMAFDLARVRPFRSLVSIVGRVILVRPGQQNRGQRSRWLGKLPATQSNALEQPSPPRMRRAKVGIVLSTIGSTSTGTGKGSPRRRGTTADNEYVTADLL